MFTNLRIVRRVIFEWMVQYHLCYGIFPVEFRVRVQCGGPHKLMDESGSLEEESLNIARENRRYIEQVIQPSYGISSSWKNQYHNEWVLKGGSK